MTPTSSTIALFILAWLACGVAAAGVICAAFMRSAPINIRLSIMALKYLFLASLALGASSMIFAILAVVLDGRFYGWLWPWSAKAKREAGL